VHDVRVALDGHEIRHGDAAELADAADVVAGQIHQHEVLGFFLFIGEQFLFQGGILGVVGPARRVPAMGRISTRPSVRRTCTSGEAPTMEKSPASRMNM
jgi:hypothetical protein